MPLPEAVRTVVRHLLDPQTLAGVIETIVLLAVIAASALVTMRLSLAVIRRAEARASGHPVRTLAPILDGLVRYTIALAALLLMLEAVHVNVTAVVASAGVIGLAFGLGAQYLIRDFLAGFFLLSEGAIQAGDLVRIDGDLGTVERITLRFTQIRKFSGELLTIQNGTISRIGNLSRDYGRAVVQVTVPYRADVGQALQVLRDVGKAWAASHAQETLDPPALDGVVDLRDMGMVLQMSVRVPPGQQAAMEAELRQRALEAFASRGIVIETRLPVA